MTKHVIEFIHVNPNKYVRAQRDIRGQSWSLARVRWVLQCAKVRNMRATLSFLSCTCQDVALA